MYAIVIKDSLVPDQSNLKCRGQLELYSCCETTQERGSLIMPLISHHHPGIDSKALIYRLMRLPDD